MPTFQPPTVDDVPAVIGPVPPFPRGTPKQRFFSHMKSRARGRTLIYKTDGTFVLVDWPAQMVRNDSSEGDVFIEQGLAGIPYTDIRRVFMGGHIHSITQAEANALTAAGFSDGLGGNLLTAEQADFEGGTTVGWAASVTILANTTAQAAHGTRSMTMTRSTSPSQPSAITPLGVFGVPIQGNTLYTAMASFRAATVTQTTQIGLLFFDAAGTLLSLPVSNGSDSTSVWTQLRIETTSPVSAVFVTLRIIVANISSPNEIHYVDQTGLFEGSVTTWYLP